MSHGGKCCKHKEITSRYGLGMVKRRGDEKEEEQGEVVGIPLELRSLLRPKNIERAVAVVQAMRCFLLPHRKCL
jgi:hypothetical protein